MTPELAASLNAAANNDAIVELAGSLGVASYLQKDSIGATLNQLLRGTDLGDTAERLLSKTTESRKPE